MKENIDPFEYAAAIFKNLPHGILLTSSYNGKINCMTIGWGMLGIEWSVPIFTVFVRENRYTRTCLEHNPEFTINAPIDKPDRKITAFMGAKSGRDIDKVAAMNLHLEDSVSISTPGVKEFPLTLECKIIYKQKQDATAIPQAFKDSFYPQDVDGFYPMANRDYHTAYYGQIVAAYIIK